MTAVNHSGQRLPQSFASNPLGLLIARSKQVGLFVRSIGGERYMVTDKRQRILLRQGTLAEVQQLLDGMGG